MKKPPIKRRTTLFLFSFAIVISIAFFYLLNRPAPPDEMELELYFRAVNAFEEGKLQLVIDLTSPLTEKNPSFHQAGLLQAKSYFFSDRWEDAAFCLQTLMRDIKNYNEAGIWLMRVRVQQGDLKGAKLIGEELLSKAPGDPRILGLLARIAFTGGDYQRAIEYYKRAILFEEELAINRIELAKIYNSLMNTEEAVKHLKKSLVLLSDNSPLKPGLMSLIERNGEIE